MAPIQITRVAPAETARTFGINHYRDAARAGITVSQLLERQDPTSAYPENERGLDAFERVMREAGLIANPLRDRGIQASTWEEATETAERRALMHEFCARVWRQATA